MPKRTNNFQSLILHIYKQIVPEGGRVTESGMVYDKDAEILREVDILVEYKYAGHEFNFIVECRDHSRKQSVEWIDALVGKAKSLNVNKVIAVSSKGFSNAAKTKANENNIETLTLEEASDTHWGEFPIKPGIVLMSEDTYQIRDVLYWDDDQFIPVKNLGFTKDVELNGEIVGNLKDVVEFFFREHIVKQIDQYKRDNFAELFKTKEDTEKIMLVESEYTWPELIVTDNKGRKVVLRKVKYIISGVRKTVDVEQDHKILSNKTLSVGRHQDSDGTIIELKIVQDPDTQKMHVNWIKGLPDKDS